MATRTYYGICTSESTDTQKRVKVSDTDIKSGFNFQEGDLLVVFFAHTNTESNPSIVVYNQDTNYEVSFTTDEGKLIKSIDIEAGMENAWAAGETVIFAYTQQSTAEPFYWELVDGNHASVETYGDTKLFDDNELNNLLAGTYDGDEDIALTPNTLKKFFDLLTVGKEEEEEEEDEQPLGLKWTSSETGEVQNLGILSLTNNTDGVTITYPIESKITQMVNDLRPENITHTGQLINNGNGATGEDGATSEDAEPFITRIVPENLYLNGDQNGIFYGTPDSAANIIRDTGTQVIIGNDSLTDGILLNKFTTIGGNLTVRGTLTTTGTISATNANIITNGNISGSAVYGGTVYENYKGQSTPLRNIYGLLYKVERKNVRPSTGSPQTVTMKANSSHNTNDDIHFYLNVDTESGWTPIGVVGYNISELKSGEGQPSLMNLWESCIVTHNGNKCVQYALYNHGNKKNKVYVTFSILYMKS